MGYTSPQLYTVPGATTKAYGLGTATTNILEVYSNLVNSRPTFQMQGANEITMLLPDGKGFRLVDNTGSYFLKQYWVTPDTILETYNNYNLFLNPNGTGKVKFGTYVAGVKADSIGYIEVLDSGGTSRRLMVQSA